MPNSVIPGDGSVTRIAKHAFQRSELTQISIPEGITHINDNAFMDCNNITAIDLPHSLTHIGYSMLSRARSLTSITYTGSMAQWDAIAKGEQWDAQTGDYIVYCIDGTVAKDGAVAKY